MNEIVNAINGVIWSPALIFICLGVSLPVQEWLQRLPERLANNLSCHAVYVGIGIIRINWVLLAALIQWQ